MPLAYTRAVALHGITGHLVEVEAQTTAGLPAVVLVGLPDAALREARERVRAAIGSCGLEWRERRTTVNLSPAGLPKAGTGFDLALAVAMLGSQNLVEAERAARAVHLGELGLDGRVLPVRGVLPAVRAAVGAGHCRVVVPAANAAEAELVPGARVHAVEHLADLVADYGGRPRSRPCRASSPGVAPPITPEVGKDLAEVVGQAEARRALEVAAAGGHHLLLIGTAGAGKTMLAERLPGLLPPLEDEAALEVTALQSLAGALGAASDLVRRAPFQAPHHSATAAAILGGGTGLPRPGAVSLAHGGVLFLDEAPEFAARVLDALRQPLESGQVVLHRAAGSATYPARFQLVLAANPCPCGNALSLVKTCTCSPQARRRYLTRLSGPLLDRLDLRVRVEPLQAADLAAGAGECTAEVAERVVAARERAAHRWRGTPWRLNSQVPGWHLRDYTEGLAPGADQLLHAAFATGAISMRGLDRILRVAWTLADLAGAGRVEVTHVGAATALREGVFDELTSS